MEKETITLGEAQLEITKSLNTLKKGLEDMVGKKADQETVTKLANDLADAITKCDAAVAGAEAIQKELGGLKNKQNDVVKSLASQVREGITEEIVKGLKRDKKVAQEIVVKAASTITTGYALTGALANLMRAFETEPGVSKAPQRSPFILDLISVGQTASHTIMWNELVEREGGPAQTAEGGTFSLMSTKYEKKSASSKKTTVYVKITEEMMEDVDFIQSEVQTEIMEQLPLSLDVQLLSGDGTGENHLGILAQATAFAKPTGFTALAAPNEYDVLRAAILQIQRQYFFPSAIILNPSDCANMELTKDADGRYLPVPFMTADGKIKGVPVVENMGVAEGSFLLGDFKRAKLFIKRDITIRFWDQVDDDPIKDQMTVTGSLRGIFRIKGPDKKAFVKGTFSTAKTAITA